ncbi:MAG: MoxR family ATPase [Planctomycetaceae bacterium]|nr:MoxR family ATPase [Planctomycetaceae bacterium]
MPVEPARSSVTEHETPRDVDVVRGLQAAVERLRGEIGRVIVGQNEVVEQLLVALCCRAHCLLVGVPGLAKTLLVNTLAKSLQLSFRRIQFTPDLMPADMTGTDVLQENPETGQRMFQFIPGPLFSHLVLADEINRTPPKTQAALLEAMQERHVTVGTNTYRLPDPFFVLATQNPIEQEGTYPLPEAQLDRFMMNIHVGYPSAEEELQILRQTTGGAAPIPARVLTARQILAVQELVRQIPLADSVYRYARDLVRATRPDEPTAPAFVRDSLRWGAGPRAGQFLVLGAKARALLSGRFHATTDDIRALALPILRHRLVTTFAAESAGQTVERVIERLLAEIPDGR